MASSSKLAEVIAMIAERDEDFRDLASTVRGQDSETGEVYFALSALASVLKIERPQAVKDALNRAKIAASKGGLSLTEHFKDGTIFQIPGDVLLSKYAAYLLVMNCSPEEGRVALAQVYFALQVDRQRLEDERRLKTRLDVASENDKLAGVAKSRGVQDFAKFQGMGIQGLYGGLSVAEIKRKKGLPPNGTHLDFAGSEELAANLFRITQTRAALQRQGYKSEDMACTTHKNVGERVRKLIIDAGNTPPEELRPAALQIDKLASQTKKELARVRNS